jgi:hypothetical protein
MMDNGGLEVHQQSTTATVYMLFNQISSICHRLPAVTDVEIGPWL